MAGKYEKKKEKEKKRLPLAVIIAVSLVVLVIFVLYIMPPLLYRIRTGFRDDEFAQDPTAATQSQEDVSPTLSPEDALVFPVLLDEEKIEVSAPFRFDGVNPDAERREGEGIAAVEITNHSGQHVSEMTLVAFLGDGAELTFYIEELPAGASAMAFSVDNATLELSDFCVDMTAEVIYEDAPAPDGLEVFAQGMTITAANTSSEDMHDIDVYYRDVFNEKYFGGKTYICTIENLSAGESVTVPAGESLMGMVDVVRVAVNEMN